MVGGCLVEVPRACCFAVVGRLEAGQWSPRMGMKWVTPVVVQRSCEGGGGG